jgi:hypothetical protein
VLERLATRVLAVPRPDGRARILVDRNDPAVPRIVRDRA